MKIQEAKKKHRRQEVQGVTDENYVVCVRDSKSRDSVSFLQGYVVGKENVHSEEIMKTEPYEEWGRRLTDDKVSESRPYRKPSVQCNELIQSA